MYSTLRKGLKYVFNYSILSIVKSHSNSGKGVLCLHREIVFHILAKASGSSGEVCDHSVYPVLGLRLLHIQSNESTWNGWAPIYHSSQVQSY